MPEMPQPITARGPLVWRDMDQKALDDAYDQDVYAPNRPLIVARRIAASERARAILGPPQRVAYGPSEYEGLDIFRAAASERADQRVRPWRRLAPQQGGRLCLQAEPLVHAGAHAVIIDFINVEQAGGDLFPMYEQVRRALAWTWRNAESFGGDRERFYISAHSSGSHLAACFLTDGWREEDLPKDFLQRRAAAQRHVRARAGAALEALVLRHVHRRDGGEAQLAAPSRRPAHAARSRLRHLRDAGIPAPDARGFSRRCRLRESPPN